MQPDNNKNKKDFERLSSEYINSVKDNESNTYNEGKDEVWNKIEKSIQHHKHQKIKKNLIYYISAAACLLLLLGGTYLFFNEGGISEKQTPKFVEQEIKEIESNEIRLLTASNETLVLKEESDLKYDKEGNILVDSETLGIAEKAKTSMNQLIVPKGKRINIYLSDGTRMFVNSNTRVKFPSVFDDSERKILVDGEVYLDVTRNEKCPFLVETDRLTVHVLGTSFNVNSYSDAEESTIVLVTGKVEVETKGEKTATLAPNEMFRMKGTDVETKKVDVSEYICWTQNVMMFKNEPLNKALTRLSTYYGHEIVQESQLSNIPLNGKIDLRDDFKEVLSIIEATVPVKFTSVDGSTYTVKKQ